MLNEIVILHVDDEPDFADLTGTCLEREDDRFAVETATSADEGLQRISDRPPDCIVSDYNMPGMDGIEFLQAVREEYPDLPFILFTGKGSEAVASDAISAGVTDYLQKASGTEQYELLANRLRNAVEARREAERADRQEQLMRLTEFAGDTGGFELDVDTGDILLTDGARRLVGLPDDAHITLEEAIEFYHPDDQAEVRQTVSRAAEAGEETQGTWRLQTPNGDERLVNVTLTPADGNGDATTLRGAIHDITERKKRERELRAERRFVEQALDTLDDLFYVLDSDGTLRRWNDRVPEITGYTDEELADMDAIELFSDGDRETIAGAIETALADGEATVETDLRTADGDCLPYEFTGAQLTDEDGTVIGLVGVGRDLTERRQRERRFQALVEESKDNISVIDTNGVFQYQSPAIKRILGYEPEETIGDTAWEYIHPDDRERLKSTFEEWVTTPEPAGTVEYRARHADGSWRWMEANGNNQLDNPAIEGYIINSRDITERKEDERKLQNITTQYEVLVKNFPGGGVFLLDQDMRFVRVGGNNLERIGLTSADFEGNTPHDLYPGDVADEQVQYLEKTFDGESYTYRQEFQGKHYELRTMPIRDDTGEVVYAMAVSRDITQQVEQKHEVQRQNKRLEEFTSIVSHDLRNPLRVAEGRLELIREECNSNHIDDVAQALDRMDALIEDLLTLAREGDQLDETDPVVFTDMATNSWQTVNTEQATLETGTVKTIQADQGRLQQLVENLYRNAIEHGGDDVTVSVGAMDDGFYVADTGSGIPECDREEVFEAGYSTSEDGTGFGLRIVKQVADAHGWEVAISESEEGGARFEITGVEKIE